MTPGCPDGKLADMIDAEQLRKSYGSATAVDGLSFVVEPGRVTGFLGPNGAGKSTTLRMMLGLARPDRGQVLIAGRRYAEIRDPLRTVGALLDATDVHGGRSAYQHLWGLARSNGVDRRRVTEVLSLTGLEQDAGHRVRTFSLGMRQRLGLAAALLGDPPVLLLDEPLNGLDPGGVRWMRTFLRDLAAEGRTVLVSSHLMSEMAITADHLIVIDKGRLLAATSLADFTIGSESLEDAFLRLTESS
jgi:ABC-2 type transport system ATP-binding protein